MYLLLDLNNNDHIPKLNDIIIENKVNNKILDNCYFISFKYLKQQFIITNIIYNIPYESHVYLLDINSEKYKHIFYITNEIQNLLINVERNIIQKYYLSDTNKIIDLKLCNKLIKNTSKIIYFDKKNVINPKLYIKFIGICENNFNNTISIIYKLLINE